LTRALYEIANATQSIVFIEDLNGPVSVTNDAEAVCFSINRYYPNRRILYMDTDKNWDELLHDKGVFRGFRIIPREVTWKT
jgi:hypothetical protein